jgi:hypothetical protein
MVADVRDCECKSCVGACEYTPGLFAPGEAERAAARMGMSFEDFRHDFLQVQQDWRLKSPWPADARPYAYAPRMSNMETGCIIATIAESGRHARCVFLGSDKRCSIHPVKPMECRLAMCCDRNRLGRDESLAESGLLRQNIFEMWRREGDPIRAEAEAVVGPQKPAPRPVRGSAIAGQALMAIAAMVGLDVLTQED